MQILMVFRSGYFQKNLQITGWQNNMLNEHCYTTAEACRIDRMVNDVQLADPRRNLMLKFADGNTIIICTAFIVTVVTIVIVVIINSFVITSVIDVVSFVNVHRYRHHYSLCHVFIVVIDFNSIVVVIVTVTAIASNAVVVIIVIREIKIGYQHRYQYQYLPQP